MSAPSDTCYNWAKERKLKCRNPLQLNNIKRKYLAEPGAWQAYDAEIAQKVFYPGNAECIPVSHSICYDDKLPKFSSRPIKKNFCDRIAFRLKPGPYHEDDKDGAYQEWDKYCGEFKSERNAMIAGVRARANVANAANAFPSSSPQSSPDAKSPNDSPPNDSPPNANANSSNAASLREDIAKFERNMAQRTIDRKLFLDRYLAIAPAQIQDFEAKTIAKLIPTQAQCKTADFFTTLQIDPKCQDKAGVKRYYNEEKKQMQQRIRELQTQIDQCSVVERNNAALFSQMDSNTRLLNDIKDNIDQVVIGKRNLLNQICFRTTI